jgi:hypothetical protein
MNRHQSKQVITSNPEKRADNESTLLPILLVGLILIVIGAGVVMTVV